MVVVVVVVALVLGGLAYDCANAGSGSSADKGALETPAKECTEGRAPGSPDEGAFTWADTALAMIRVVVVVIARVAVVVVVAAARAVAHAVIVGAVVVMVLCGQGNDACCDQEGSKEKRFSEPAHSQLDANFSR
jgi:hypothetical protein